MPSATTRPGFHPARLRRLMHDCIAACRLDLGGRLVVTEAATGAYVVTPVLAALAGARVQAFTRPTRYGTVEDVIAETMALAELAGVGDRIQVVFDRTRLLFESADVVTNSGHLRPLDARVVRRLKAGAVIPLMFEDWEFRAEDLDLQACRQRGIPVAGTNERHPAVDVFSFLGPMALKLLFDAGIAVYRSRIVLLCDNPFARYIAGTLERSATEIAVLQRPEPVRFEPDAVLVALTPATDTEAVRGVTQAIAAHYPTAAVVQYWGDLDRGLLRERDVPVWPPDAPASGHMSVLPGDIGPEAIVRLQTGGLKVAQVLLTPPAERSADDAAFVQPI